MVPRHRAETGPTHIKDLVPDPKNRRAHNPRNIGMVVDALHQVGAARSIVIDENDVILAGNGVTEAAAEAGITKVRVIEAAGDELIAVRRSGLTDEQKRALAIYDNRTGELASWDFDQLAADKAAGLSLQPFWSAEEEAALLAKQGPKTGNTDPDEVPPERPTGIVAGDLFELGRHLLLCGNCTSRDDVTRLTGNVIADLGLTDPPYGIGEGYASIDDSKQNLALLATQFFPLIREQCKVLLLTPGNANQRLYPAPDWTLCWFVSAGTGSGPWGFSCWQPVLAYGKDPYLAEGKGRRPDALAKTESAENKLAHPCPKPVGVWSWFVERGSVRAGQVVFDPFSGSGTTLIAAEQLERKCVALEIEPRYCQVIIDRWEAFTGQVAVKVGALVHA